MTVVGRWKNVACNLKRPFVCQAAMGEPGKICADIDECSADLVGDHCDENAECTNLPGSV